ncbi:MAG TPA: hypothetical protein PLD54_01035 [Candidatus Levybacteria bacterium]|nr:hypothetical protein [Candidatus Levybacteria bacterium]
MDKLPTVKEQKKINIKNFESLAKRVKNIFEEESIIIEKMNTDENIKSRKFLFKS